MIMGVGRVIAKVSSNVCVCVCARVCVYMYSCLTFKLFDEKNSSLPRAEYESLYANQQTRKKIKYRVFCRKFSRL